MEKFCTKCGSKLVKGECPKCGVEKDSTSFSTNGIINRAALKEAAKEKLNGNMWTIWKPYVIVMLITGFLGLFAGIFPEDSTGYQLITLLADILVIPLSFGVTKYVLDFIRGKEVTTEGLFDYYKKNVINIFLLTFLVGLFTTLWSILLIIPGIIAALSYSMYMYIYVDGKVTEPIEVIKESKRITYGYKADYFLFNFSFIGWALLCLLIIPIVYVLPYTVVANAMYYEELKTIKESE